MHNIISGKAVKHGSDIWRVVDSQGNIQTKFNHTIFNYIVDDTPVYCVDLDLDPEYCENVQSKLNVDQRVKAATPTNGFQQGAELRLRSYIMDALLEALHRQGQNRSTYLNSLDKKMVAIKTNAELLQAKKVTIALLKKMNISG